jgi:hypothetical protein
LTLEEHSKLIIAPCTYCGAERSSTLNYLGLVLWKNGIDRIDNHKGYTLENCVTACTFCNTLRASIGWETWASLINDVALHRAGAELLPNARSTRQRAEISYYRGR